MTDSRLLVSFYGDDLTGSTDVMEALTRGGVRTVLFLAPPTRSDLQRFPGVRAVGVAGMTRTMSNRELDTTLGPAFEALRALDASVFHYKICSTFDSSPTVGSIGHAVDLGQAVFASPFVPLVVGAPALRRYSLFGNLFATVGDQTFRLDRHPTMRQHPVTPMDEGDLRVHLGRQTDKSIALMDILHLSGRPAEVDRRFATLLDGKPDLVLFDVLDEARLAEVGRLIWTHAASNDRTLFTVGSSGVEYALTGHWRQSGLLPATPPALPAPGTVDQLLVVSGSCSPTTEGQIAWALADGFVGVDVDAPRLLDPKEGPATRTAVIDQILTALSTGNSVVAYSARGPQDPRIDQIQSRSAARHRDPLAEGKRLGEELGGILRTVLGRHRLRRVVIAGGDTSGHGARQLGIDALEMIAPIAPGGPLCRAYARSGDLDGLELVLKGGQVGQEDFFGRVRKGVFS